MAGRSKVLRKDAVETDRQPFPDLKSVVLSYSAMLNLEEPPWRFFAGLHKDCRLIGKHFSADGREDVWRSLLQWAQGMELEPKPLTAICVPIQRQRENGEWRDICCSVFTANLTESWTKTSFDLSGDGLVTQISVYTDWLDPTFPFPDRARAVIDRLRAKGITVHQGEG